MTMQYLTVLIKINLFKMHIQEKGAEISELLAVTQVRIFSLAVYYVES
jgi:hypothetical protein